MRGIPIGLLLASIISVSGPTAEAGENTVKARACSEMAGDWGGARARLSGSLNLLRKGSASDYPTHRAADHLIEAESAKTRAITRLAPLLDGDEVVAFANLLSGRDVESFDLAWNSLKTAQFRNIYVGRDLLGARELSRDHLTEIIEITLTRTGELLPEMILFCRELN